MASRFTRLRASPSLRSFTTPFLLFCCGLCIGFLLTRHPQSSATTTSDLASVPLDNHVAPVAATRSHTLTTTQLLQSLDCASVSHPTQTDADKHLDLPTLFGIHTLLNSPADNHANDTVVALRQAQLVAACKAPTSLIAHYVIQQSVCARQPYRPHLLKALQTFRKTLSVERYAFFAKSDDVLVVHLDACTSTISSAFRAALLTQLRAHPLALVVPVCTVASADTSVVSSNVASLVAVVKQVALSVSKPADDVVIRPVTQDPQADLALFSIARRVLVHQGAFGALIGLAVDGIVYHSSAMKPYIDHTLFRWALADGREGGTTSLPMFLREWRMTAGVLQSCCEIDHIGRGDGEKFLCTNMKTLRHPGCWVLSIGCGGLFQFERHVVDEWGCSVSTFDCTGSWKVPEDIADRVSVTKLCVGDGVGARRHLYKPLSELIGIGAKAAGLKEDTPPVLLKIDVEGFEYPVLQHMIATTPRELLPKQIVAEFHLAAPVRVGWRFGPSVTGDWHPQRLAVVHSMELLGNLTNAGYRVVHRADNPGDRACSELTLVRREFLPDSVAPFHID